VAFGGSTKLQGQITKKSEKVRNFEKRECDGCGKTGDSRNICKLRTVKYTDNSALYLCKNCWTKEMGWRKLKNQDLGRKSYPIRAWPGRK